jgi:hypothetical protein
VACKVTTARAREVLWKVTMMTGWRVPILR